MFIRARSGGWRWPVCASLVGLALLGACDQKKAPSRPPLMPSSGLPTLTGGSGSLDAAEPVDAAVAPPLPDAAVVPALPDAARDQAGTPDAALVIAADGPDPLAGNDGPVADGPVLLPTDDAMACTGTSATARPLPVDVLVVLDRSGSMSDPIYGLTRDGGAYITKWESIVEALGNFVSSPAAAGLHVGLSYFPPTDASECDAMRYASPPVAIDALPANAMRFIQSLMTTRPGGATPTLPALQGAYQLARERETMLGRRTAIALATDGQPNSCGSSIGAVSDLARMAADQGILTFVIGVGPSLQSFNGLAMAGGTGTAYLVANATPNELATAFKTVQTQASRLACSFMVPPPPPGETIDTQQVGVRFTPTATPTSAFEIAMVNTRTDCGPTGGWFFDDILNPTTVSLCEASCQKVNGSGEGQLSLQFGCRQR